MLAAEDAWNAKAQLLIVLSARGAEPCVTVESRWTQDGLMPFVP